jgi:hypothetical protein
MKYEGKLYGKIGGRYIEAHDHVSNDKLIVVLEDKITECESQARVFEGQGLTTSQFCSEAMATAYQNIISLIKGK